MKKVLLLLIAILAFASCTQETVKDSSKIVLEPTCTKHGIKLSVIDGVTYSTLIEPTGHDTTKTAIDGGYKYTCKKCTASWTEKEVDTHSHLLSDDKCISCSYSSSCSHTLSETKSWMRYKGKDYYVSNCSKCKANVVVDAELGTEGPAGGIIFYDCDKDNESGNADGLTSATCEWRYLEASKSFLVLNGNEPTIDSTLSSYNALFNCKDFVPGIFVNDIENMATDASDPTTGYVQSGIFFDMFYRDEPGDENERVTSEEGIGKGEENTLLLVTKKGLLGEHAFFKSVDELKSRYYPANLCYHLRSEKAGTLYDDWFLPSSEELRALLSQYASIYTLGAGEYVWSSTESGNTTTFAAKITDTGAFSDIYSRGRGTTVSSKMTHGSRIIPIRAF